MNRFFEIIKEEFKNFIHDRGARLIMIIGIIGYTVAYAIPYASEIVRDVPIGVFNQDNSQLSREFVRNLNSTDYVEVKYNESSLEECQKDFYKEKIKAFVIIPKDFGHDILSGKQANVSLYTDSAYMIIYKSVYQSVTNVAINFGAKLEVGKMLKKGISKQTAMAIKQPFEIVDVPLYNPATGYATYIYPVILILIMHQTLIIGLGLLQGTRNEYGKKYAEKKTDIPFILFARCTTYVLLYLFYSFFIFLFLPALLNYPMAYDIFGLLAILLPMLYATAFFAHALSGLFQVREAPLLFMVVSSLIFIFLPGIIWPKEMMPDFVNFVANFIPATKAIDALVKVNHIGTGIWTVRYNFLWLVFLNVLYFILAIITLVTSDNKKEMKRNECN